MTVGADDTKLWVLGGVVAILVPAVAYFLVREFARKDGIESEVKTLAAKVTLSIEELNKCVAALTLAIEETRVWSHERFVTRTEHRDAIESVKDDIARHAERFERELERCEARCPERCKT